MPKFWNYYVLCSTVILATAIAFKNPLGSPKRSRDLVLSNFNEKYKCVPLKELFGKVGIFYYDGDEITEPAILPFLFTPSTSSIVAEIPLLPFEDVIFPGSREFLHVAEMRFRYIFQKVEEGDDMYGRCFISDEGAIGAIGNLCKIIERRQLDNGERQYVVQALERFRIRRIIQKTPYMTAEVEIFSKDTFVVDEVKQCEILSNDIFFLLKLYMRLTRLQTNRSTSSDVFLPPEIRENKPEEIDDNNTIDFGKLATRQEKFSNACANILSTDKVVLQQLLQSQSTLYRLQGVKAILVMAVGEVSELLKDEGLLPETELRQQELLAASDDDSDLCPSDRSGAMTIASVLGETATELDAEPAAVIGRNITGIVDAPSSSSSSSSSSDITSADDNMWEMTEDAFQ
eukprot:gene925-1792_t